MDKRFQVFKKDMQRDLLVHIVVRVRNGTITFEMAQNMSREIIDAFTKTTEPSIYEALYGIAKKHPGIADIFIKNANTYEKKKLTDDIPAIISFIKQNDIDNALRIAKGGEN